VLLPAIREGTAGAASHGEAVESRKNSAEGVNWHRYGCSILAGASWTANRTTKKLKKLAIITLSYAAQEDPSAVALWKPFDDHSLSMKL
jgi:hypothetical protein